TPRDQLFELAPRRAQPRRERVEAFLPRSLGGLARLLCAAGFSVLPLLAPLVRRRLQLCDGSWSHSGRRLHLGAERATKLGAEREIRLVRRASQPLIL